MDDKYIISCCLMGDGEDFVIKSRLFKSVGQDLQNSRSSSISGQTSKALSYSSSALMRPSFTD